jgi:hypothetical protein
LAFFVKIVSYKQNIWDEKYSNDNYKLYTITTKNVKTF